MNKYTVIVFMEDRVPDVALVHVLAFDSRDAAGCTFNSLASKHGEHGGYRVITVLEGFHEDVLHAPAPEPMV